MKGQVVNIDWVVGLTIFMVTVASATILLNRNTPLTTDTGLESKSSDVSEALRSAAQEEVEITPLYVRQPHDTGNIPVDRRYVFGDAESAYLSTASFVNVTGNRTAAVVSSGNSSYRLTAFASEVSHSFSSNINAGDELSNSYITLDPENGGLRSISFDGQEYLSDPVDLGESGQVTDKNGVVGNAFGRVKIYNGSKEVIIEDVDTTFTFNNFTELYWANGSNRQTLDGNREFEDGNTSGFVLADLKSTDYDLTATGRLDARIYRDTAGEVKVDLRSGRARLMFHSRDISYGKKRIENFKEGEIYYGAEEQTRAATEGSLDTLETMNSFSFEEEYKLRDWGYNITGEIERGTSIPLKPVAVSSRPLRVARWNGTVRRTELEVAVWQ